jgi:hypothetical protein
MLLNPAAPTTEMSSRHYAPTNGNDTMLNNRPADIEHMEHIRAAALTHPDPTRCLDFHTAKMSPGFISCCKSSVAPKWFAHWHLSSHGPNT